MYVVWKKTVAVLVSVSILMHAVAGPVSAGDGHPTVRKEVATDIAVAVAGAGAGGLGTAALSVPATSGDISFIDIALPALVEMVRNPMGDNSIFIGLVWFLTIRTARFGASMYKIGDTWQARKATREELKRLTAEYELRHTEYETYPARIQEIEKESLDLRKQLEEAESLNRYATIERLRRKLEGNQSVIQAMKDKVPVLKISHAIAQIAETTAKLRQSLDELGKLNPHAQTAAKLSGITYRPDYVGEWLKTDDGKTFTRTRSGARWKERYETLIREMGERVEEGARIYQFSADSHNAVAPIEEHVPRMASHKSEYGHHPDHYMLIPENPSHQPKEVRLKQLEGAVSDVCAKNMGFLKKKMDVAKEKTKFHYAYRSQIYNGGMVLGAVGGLALFAVNFESRHKKPFTEVRDESRRDAKIKEAARIDIAGQMDDDKTKAYRLKPLVDSTVRVIQDHEDQIIQIIETRLTLRDENSGKRELLEKRVEVAEHNKRLETAKVSASLEDAMKKVFKASTWATLDDVLENVYTDDLAKRDTVVNRHLTLIFREAIATLYSNLVDEPTLDIIETSLIPKMVSAVTPDLKKIAEEKKKAQNLNAADTHEEPQKPADASGGKVSLLFQPSDSAMAANSTSTRPQQAVSIPTP